MHDTVQSVSSVPSVCSHSTPVVVPKYLCYHFGICSVLLWYFFGFNPKKYQRYTKEIPKKYQRNKGGALELHGSYTESSLKPHLTEIPVFFLC